LSAGNSPENDARMKGRIFAALLCALLPLRAELSPAGLRAAADYSKAKRGARLLVIQRGRTLLDEGGGAYKIYSGTKGFWGLAVLAAQEDGVLDLDERVSAILPEWAAGKKAGVTLRQLLNFTAGLPETYALHNDGWADRDAHALRQALVGPPGRAFIYGPAALQIMHAVLKRRLAPRGETPTQYLERRVLRPLGLGPQRYLADQAGNPLLATGFVLSAAQWSKMGRAVLADGAPVLRDSLGEARRGSNVNPMFALGFWSNRLAASSAREIDPEEELEKKWHRQDWRGTCLSRAAPSDLLACIGSGGQRLYVVPSLSLIIVRQGQLAKFSDREFLRRMFGPL
jgi:CubicO group peptidase (beta-lactamase class C family)